VDKRRKDVSQKFLFGKYSNKIKMPINLEQFVKEPSQEKFFWLRSLVSPILQNI
jgi:hypothetical protein